MLSIKSSNTLTISCLVYLEHLDNVMFGVFRRLFKLYLKIKNSVNIVVVILKTIFDNCKNEYAKEAW